MERTLASGAEDAGSTPARRTFSLLKVIASSNL